MSFTSQSVLHFHLKLRWFLKIIINENTAYCVKMLFVCSQFGKHGLQPSIYVINHYTTDYCHTVHCKTHSFESIFSLLRWLKLANTFMHVQRSKSACHELLNFCSAMLSWTPVLCLFWLASLKITKEFKTGSTLVRH